MLLDENGTRTDTHFAEAAQCEWMIGIILSQFV